MEKQRSFSFKSTKCLIFSLTLSFSLFLICFLSLWDMKYGTGGAPSFHLETYWKIENKPYGDLKPLVGLTSNLSGPDAKASNLMQTLFRKPQNSSGFGGDLDLEETLMDKDEPEEVMDDEEILDLEVVDGEVREDIEEGHVEIEGGDDGNVTVKGDGYNGNYNSVSAESEIPSGQEIVVKSKRVCDVSRGRWVFYESYPLYTNVSCPFIDEGFNCKGNGRLDGEYMKWRWQPQDCDIPRFNATKMLEMIRRKRLVFVGDSINRSQWESMLCLLMGAVKDPKKVYETHGRRIQRRRGATASDLWITNARLNSMLLITWFMRARQELGRSGFGHCELTALTGDRRDGEELIY